MNRLVLRNFFLVLLLCVLYGATHAQTESQRNQIRQKYDLTKLDEVEAKLEGQDPALKEPVEEVTVDVSPLLPEKSTVGVIRNGRRDEYKVEHWSGDQVDSAIGVETEVEEEAAE